MTAITDYNSLVQNLIDVAEDDGDEFEAYIPTAIRIAEDRLFRECDFPDLEYLETGSLTINNNSVNKPDDLKFIKWFRITQGSNNILLRRRTDDFLIDYWPNPAATGTPKYYAYNTESLITIAPTPDAAYTYAIKYAGAPLNLSASQTTNYYTENCSDLLFHACMVEMAKFMKAWTQVEIWELYYKNGKEGWNAQAARERRDNGETPLNQSEGPNTLVHTLPTRS